MPNLLRPPTNDSLSDIELIKWFNFINFSRTTQDKQHQKVLLKYFVFKHFL